VTYTAAQLDALVEFLSWEKQAKTGGFTIPAYRE
jgi:hypothetical protein